MVASAPLWTTKTSTPCAGDRSDRRVTYHEIWASSRIVDVVATSKSSKPKTRGGKSCPDVILLSQRYRLSGYQSADVPRHSAARRWNDT
ncbi:hypothetical protein EVAR_41158_1 [Eumeta japonica]|uniref:Uncharacterized protein n=1 Tax=Eumeta variegata TaxID=151549 RepID=A0A4C1Y9F5_EUMVA|nr:hypothetical protein EVAR_41158_1 [Eumeta japonica]